MLCGITSVWHHRLENSRHRKAAARSCSSYEKFPKQLSRSSSKRGQHRISCFIHPSAGQLVGAGDTPVGKGLITCQTLQQGSCLLHVPLPEVVAVADLGVKSQTLHTTLKDATAAYSDMPRGLLHFVQGTTHVALRLAATLLWLRNHGSAFWHDYIASLPQEADMSCLLNYTPEEQPELQHLAASAELEHQQACHFHDTIFSSSTGRLQAWNLADRLQDTLWALSMVYSRALTDQIPDTEASVSMMVPKVDLANHSFDANAEWVADFTNGTVTLQAIQDIAEGMPVCIDYGADVDNTDLMRIFGFVVPGNPNDRFAWVPVQDGQAAAAQQDNKKNVDGANQLQPYLLAGPLLKCIGLDSIVKQFDQDSCWHNGQSIVSCHNQPNLSRKLAALLSLPVIDSDHQAEADNGGGYGRKPFQAESGSSIGLNSGEIAQQRQSAEHLQGHCHAILDSYATSISTDQELLERHQQHTSQRAQQALTPRHAQAVRARLEHKLLIAAAVKLLETYSLALSAAEIHQRGMPLGADH